MSGLGVGTMRNINSHTLSRNPRHIGMRRNRAKRGGIGERDGAGEGPRLLLPLVEPMSNSCKCAWVSDSQARGLHWRLR